MTYIFYGAQPVQFHKLESVLVSMTNIFYGAQPVQFNKLESVLVSV
jgi:hypothetical protein